MNKNMYAYMLVGAVILAGFAGYLIADNDVTEVEMLPDVNEFTVTANIASNTNIENMEESNGKAETS